MNVLPIHINILVHFKKKMILIYYRIKIVLLLFIILNETKIKSAKAHLIFNVFLKNIMGFNYSKCQIISSGMRKHFLGTKKYTYFTVCPPTGKIPKWRPYFSITIYNRIDIKIKTFETVTRLNVFTTKTIRTALTRIRYKPSNDYILFLNQRVEQNDRVR